MNQAISIPAPAPSLTIKPYWGIDNTLVNIKSLIKEFKNSPAVTQFDGLALSQIFDIVKNIPYFEDPAEFEWLQSPIRTLERGGDCDDKSLLLGAIFDRLGIPYRMAVVSTLPSKDLHHIYPELYILGVWLPFDATYPYNKMFSENPFTLKRIYDWTGGKTLTYEFENNNPATLTEQLTSKDIPSLKKIPGVMRIKTLAGPAGVSGNVRLAILRGNSKPFYQVSGNGKCNCNECSKKYTCPRSKVRISRPLKKALLLGYINSINRNGLGIDPATITTVLTTVANLFSTIFGGGSYQDAYNVWAAAEQKIAPAHAAWVNEGKPLNSNNLDTVAAQRSIVAVLSRDYMNPPPNGFGPPPQGFCTSPNRCGNRAEWSAIQSEVQQKVSALAPFMKWMVYNGESSHTIPWNDFSLEGLVQIWDMVKNGSGLYQQYVAESQNPVNDPNNPNYNPNDPTSPKQAGMSGMQVLLLGGAAAFFIYMISQKKKGRA